MKKFFYKFVSILILLKNLILRKRKYRLTFRCEKDDVMKRWFYVFPFWGFDTDNLEMVMGADGLCEKYSMGKDIFTIDIMASKKPLSLEIYKDYAEYIRYDYEGFMHGASYINKISEYSMKDQKEIEKVTTMWICPVALFVFGRYPRYIYIKTK